MRMLPKEKKKKTLEDCTLFHHVTSLCAACLPWSVAGSIAGLLPRAAVDGESPFAGVTAVCFPHTFFIQKTNLW